MKKVIEKQSGEIGKNTKKIIDIVEGTIAELIEKLKHTLVELEKHTYKIKIQYIQKFSSRYR